MLDAARAKARRGELRISVPIGYVWHRDLGLGFDPDLRIQEAIRQIFEISAARQRSQRASRDVGRSGPLSTTVGRPEAGHVRLDADHYRNVISVLKNPFYAGAYAYGKSEKRIEIVGAAPARATATADLLKNGRPCSRITTRVHRLGEVQSEPGAARLERLWPGGRPKVRARRKRPPVRAHHLRALRTAAGGGLYGTMLAPAGLSLRSPQMGRPRCTGIRRLAD